jgi:hypothetical protein
MSQVRVFQCPNCKEFIATDAKTCRFCAATITAEGAQAQANLQGQQDKIDRVKKHTRQMLIGAAMFVVGVIITVGSYSMAASSAGGGRYLITYGPIIFGAIRFVQGGVGWLGEQGKS